MFKQRLLTTLVLVPLALLAIYYAYPWVLFLVVLSAVIAGGWEWLQLIPLVKPAEKVAYMLVLVCMVWLCSIWFGAWLMVDSLLWLLILYAVVTFPNSQRLWGYPLLVGLLGLLLLPMLAGALSELYHHSQGKNLVVYLLFLVWAADIGAYLAGKQWGKHKLIPKVSPGKTYEGVLGGFLLSMLVAIVGYYYFTPTQGAVWFTMAALTALVSVLGDLFISMLKRRSHLKDTGHLIPGHGGVLDRLDSLLAALPIFYFMLHTLPTGL